MTETDDKFALQIAWDRPNLPGLVGPFDSRAEAEEWGDLNISNGAWFVAPLAYPYLRTPPREDS